MAMISQTPEVTYDKRMTALAVLSARLDDRSEDQKLLLESFFVDMSKRGASESDISLMLMTGMADMLAVLIWMTDEDHNVVIDKLRQRVLQEEL